MKIKKISIRAGVSLNYQHYEVEYTAELNNGDDLVKVYNDLKETVQLNAVDGLHELLETTGAPSSEPKKEKPQLKTVNGLEIRKNIPFKTIKRGSDGLSYVFTADGDGRLMWFNKSRETGECKRIYIDDNL